MGASAQSLLIRGERGAALLVAIITLLVAGVITAGVALFTVSVAQTGQRRQQGQHALNVAEAGAAHALALLRGPLATRPISDLLRGADNSTGTSDDGRLVGFGIPSGQEIAIAGRAAYGGTYAVQILDDPADTDGNAFTDMNLRAILRCNSTMADGSAAAIDVVFLRIPPLPAVVIDGSFQISGNPTITGSCGTIHGNGTGTVSGNPVVAGDVSSTGSVSVSGSITDTTGAPNPAASSQPSIPVPAVTQASVCTNPDYIGRSSDGKIWRKSTGTWHSSGTFNWSFSGGSEPKWDLSGTPGTTGVFCAEGNVVIGNSPGTAASPVTMSVFATGSIEVSGNPFLRPATGQQYLFVSEGDLVINGNPSAGQTNYGGAIHSRGHCMVSGNPAINGQLQCRNQADLPGDRDLVDESKINGNMTMRFDCSTNSDDAAQIVAWMTRPQS